MSSCFMSVMDDLIRRDETYSFSIDLRRKGRRRRRRWRRSASFTSCLLSVTYPKERKEKDLLSVDSRIG